MSDPCFPTTHTSRSSSTHEKGLLWNDWCSHYLEAINGDPNFTIRRLSPRETQSQHIDRLHTCHRDACFALLHRQDYGFHEGVDLRSRVLQHYTSYITETIEKVKRLHRCDGVIRVGDTYPPVYALSSCEAVTPFFFFF